MNQTTFLTILQQSGETQSLILILTFTLFILLLFWWAFKGEGEPDHRISPFSEPDLVREESHHHHDDEHAHHDEAQMTEAPEKAIADAIVVEPVAEAEPEPVAKAEPEPVAKPVAKAEPEPVIEKEPIQPDDLKKIEGIGPKISRILQEAGILTYAQLADTSVATLEKIVREDAGIKIAFPDTWPEQSALAAQGDWETLATLQDNLKGGRKA